MRNERKINVAKVLNGYPLAQCVTILKRRRAKRVTPLSPYTKVRYQRHPSGRVIHGFIKSATATTATLVVFTLNGTMPIKVERRRVRKG